MNPNEYGNAPRPQDPSPSSPRPDAPTPSAPRPSRPSQPGTPRPAWGPELE